MADGFQVLKSDGMEAVFEHDLFAFALAEAWKKGPGQLGRLNEVSVPTWVCAGDHDAGPMAFNKTCEIAIPNCTRTVISGCGHYPMVDATDPFISQFEAFVDASA